MQGKTGGVDWRVHGNCVYVAGEELSGIHHARRHLYYFHRRPHVWPRHETRPTRAQEQIRAVESELQQQRKMFPDVISQRRILHT